MAVVWPVQIEDDNGTVPSVGIGFTVTSVVVAVPGHPFADGVIVYRTVPPAVLVRTSVIVVPVPAPLPVTVPL